MTISPSSGHTGTFHFTIRWGKQQVLKNSSPKQLCVSSLQWNVFRRRMVVYQVTLNPIRSFFQKKKTRKKHDSFIREELSYSMPHAQSWSWKIFICTVRQEASECKKTNKKTSQQPEFIYQSWILSRRSTQQISHLLLNDLSSTRQLLHPHKLIDIILLADKSHFPGGNKDLSRLLRKVVFLS